MVKSIYIDAVFDNILWQFGSMATDLSNPIMSFFLNKNYIPKEPNRTIKLERVEITSFLKNMSILIRDKLDISEPIIENKLCRVQIVDFYSFKIDDKLYTCKVSEFNFKEILNYYHFFQTTKEYKGEIWLTNVEFEPQEIFYWDILKNKIKPTESILLSKLDDLLPTSKEDLEKFLYQYRDNRYFYIENNYLKRFRYVLGRNPSLEPT